MVTHIKRDGAWFCKRDKGKYRNLYKGQNFITFGDAHSVKVVSEKTRFCSACVKRYFEILEKITIVIK